MCIECRFASEETNTAFPNEKGPTVSTGSSISGFRVYGHVIIMTDMPVTPLGDVLFT